MSRITIFEVLYVIHHFLKQLHFIVWAIWRQFLTLSEITQSQEHYVEPFVTFIVPHK